MGSLFALTSPGGSPGVTTAALALAFTWPGSVIVAECDPAGGAVLAGFAEHDLTTTYLGSSTGVRLSYVQPTSAVSLVGRTADGSGSAWVAEPSIDPSFTSMEDEIWRRLDRRLSASGATLAKVRLFEGPDLYVDIVR